MSGAYGAYVAVPPLSLGAAVQPIQLTDVLIVTQNGVPRECTVAIFLASSGIIGMLAAELGKTYASYHATPSDPLGTTSITPVMMGLGGLVTPSASGKVLINITGNITKPATNSFPGTVQLYFGPGAAPTNGSAPSGSAVGSLLNVNSPDTLLRVPFSVTAVTTGLAVSTPCWLDLAAAAPSGGTTTITGVSITATELP